MCGAFGTFAHQAYTACLRGQLSSNVRRRLSAHPFVNPRFVHDMGSRSSASAPPLHAGGSCSARCTQPDRGHRKLSSTVATAALHRLAAAFSVFAAGSRSSPSFVPERRAHLRATPNPSPKLTRYGSLPRTLGSHGGNACASQYASPRRLGLRTCPFTRKAPLGSTVQRTLRPGPSLALLGSGRFEGPSPCPQPIGAARAPGAKSSMVGSPAMVRGARRAAPKLQA